MTTRPDQHTGPAPARSRALISTAVLLSLAAGASPGARAGDTATSGPLPIERNARLEIRRTRMNHDFGSVVQGTILEHDFELESAGSADLIIRQVKPTCGCAVGRITTETDGGEQIDYRLGTPIPPGRKVHLETALDTSRKHGTTSVLVNIYTNEPSRLTRLGLRADVEALLAVSPQSIDLGDFRMEEAQTASVEVHTLHGERIGLSIGPSIRPNPLPEGLKIELTPLAPDSQGRSNRWRVTASAADMGSGYFAYALNLTSDRPIPGARPRPDGSPARYDVNVSLSGRVLDVISAAPQALSLGRIVPGQLISRTVRVTSHEPRFSIGEELTASIRGVKGQPFQWAEHVATTLQPVPGQNAVDVTVCLKGPPDATSTFLRGELVIETGLAENPQIIVPVSGFCRAGARGVAPIRQDQRQRGRQALDRSEDVVEVSR